MPILTPQEKDFLDVFLHEATTEPFFNGPATKSLYALGVEYKDITFIAWAYEREVPKSSAMWGHSAEKSPPLPWATRDAVQARNQEVRRLWEHARKSSSTVPLRTDQTTTLAQPSGPGAEIRG